MDMLKEIQRDPKEKSQEEPHVQSTCTANLLDIEVKGLLFLRLQELEVPSNKSFAQ